MTTETIPADATPAPQARSFGAVALDLGIEPHVSAALRALRRWDDLSDVTTDDVRLALRDFQSITLGR